MLAQQAAALVFAVGLVTVVEVAGGTGWELGGHGAGDWMSAATSGLYYGAGFWFFVTGLRRVPASVARSFLPLIPVFGLAAGYLVGERLRLGPAPSRRCGRAARSVSGQESMRRRSSNPR